MALIPVSVTCYSGHTYAGEPRAFTFEGREHTVSRVVARWRTPAGPAFRVESELGVCVLSYDEGSGVWHLEFVDDQPPA